MNRRPVIDLERDLPRRPRPLAADSLSQVFGGCAASGICRPGQMSVCCPEIGCNRQPNGTYRCSTSAWS